MRREPAFCEIGVRTNFSFLEGASGPEEMVVQAARLKLGGLGIADRNSVAGVVRAHAQALQLEERYKNKDEIMVQAKKEGGDPRSYPGSAGRPSRLFRWNT